MKMRRPAVAIACVAALAATSTALADGGGTSWPSTASLAGAWTGTATSTTDTSFTFPVAATVAVSATGRPTGTVDLGAPVNCAGTWLPVSRRGAVSTFAEQITSKTGSTCVNNGVVQLSAASGGRLRYVWTRGDAGSVAYLEPVGVSGRWVGTITQAGMAPITARLRVVGVRAGQMPGSTDYSSPLSCGGILTPLGRGTQQRAVLREQITHSSNPACVGLGITTVTLRADGRLAYRWTGAGEVSTGVLRRAG